MTLSTFFFKVLSYGRHAQKRLPNHFTICTARTGQFTATLRDMALSFLFFFFELYILHLFKMTKNNLSIYEEQLKTKMPFIIKCAWFGGLVWVWVLNVCSCFLTLQIVCLGAQCFSQTSL